MPVAQFLAQAHNAAKLEARVNEILDDLGIERHAGALCDSVEMTAAQGEEFMRRLGGEFNG